MDLSTTTVDLKYILPQNEKSEFVVGTNLVFQENKNFGRRSLSSRMQQKMILVFMV